MPDTTTDADIAGLADQALDNLVHQFARPLDFLRELVQNAIDAGTPRVEVWTRYVPAARDDADGVLEIHVDDFGEGMDEACIDSQLTRMFSSTKEGDLTKIGKFGIGFTSIFAIQPEAVLLRTGRHGESWELLFHADRSFDKVRIDEPVVGTRITLFERMPASAVEGFVRECRWVLAYWCEHSDTPVLFGRRDGEGAAAAATSAGADPFAAFAGGGDGVTGMQTLTSPLGIDAELAVEHVEGGVRVVVGYTDEPRYGFYNGGLTLVSTRNPEVLGVEAEDLLHLTFKVKSDALEHTLTRDNVLQDDHWRHAMEVLRRAAGKLHRALLDRADEAIAGGDDPTRWHRWLARECVACGLHDSAADFDDRARFPLRGGGTLSLAEAAKQEKQHGAVLLDPGDGPLADALDRAGIELLRDHPVSRELLLVSKRPSLLWFFDEPRAIARADELFAVPDALDEETLPGVERRLVADAEALVREAAGKRFSLRLGGFGGADVAVDLPLVLESPDGGGVCKLDPGFQWRLPAFLRKPTLVINRHHEAYDAQLAAAAADPALAAYGLAQLVLHARGEDRDRRYRKLLAAAGEAHLATAGEADGWGEQP